MSIGLQRGFVSLEPHSIEWETSAKVMIETLKNILNNVLVDAQHIGSTSIKSIWAKPIIDIVVGVSSFDKLMNYNDVLREHGIVYCRQDQPEQHLYVSGDFQRDIRTHHIHAVIYGAKAWTDYLNMRDYLNAHEDEAMEYSRLKEQLADLYPNDRIAYTNGKHDFIVNILRKARDGNHIIQRSLNMKTALSIAGTDPSGGAGIQADLKTMTMNGVFAMSAITALVAQNTTGVKEIVEMSPEFLERQIDVVFEDIPPDAVKIGMVASCGLIETIAQRLRHYQAKNIVVDPVMVATSGDRLISEEAVDTLKNRLLPLSAVTTPNIPEAEILSGMTIQNREDIEAAAKRIGDEFGCAVLLKGGHNINDANDYLYSQGKGQWFEGRRIDNPNTHGTGCTLSSAIASNLAKGFDLPESIQRSKDYLSGALGAMLDLGRGRGPMRHNFNLTGKFAEEADGT